VSETPTGPEDGTAATGADERQWYQKPLNLVAIAVIVAVALFAAFGGFGGDDEDLAIDDVEDEEEVVEEEEEEEATDEEEATEDDEEATDGEDGDDGGDGGTTAPGDGPQIVIRGQDFSEAITLAEVYGQYLQGLGYDVDILTPAGFRDEAIQGIETGELNMIVDYIGGSQTALAPDEPTSGDPEEVMEIIRPAYAELGATVLDFTPAVDGDAFVVRGDFDGETISDVPDGEVVFGASAQCFERPQCFIGYTDPDIYGIEFADTQTIEFGPLLGEALNAGEVDAVVWNDTAPQIDEFGFKVLEDDLGLHPAQNIAPILRDELIDDYGQDLIDAINELSALIETEDLIAWNTETDLEFRESDDVATEWLEENGLL
jgi:osmoprotectant transport system substrate-binding protein